MLVLNLGCGTKTSRRPEVVNVDWSPYLRLRRSRMLRRIAPLVLRGGRREAFAALPQRVVAHDLSRGIPFSADTVDVVYHSHMLEHLDRDVAAGFLVEAQRVLKRGGIHRIVVPDFGLLCRRYVESLDAAIGDRGDATELERRIADILEQSVRREAHGTSRQPPLRRRVENLLLGDARKRGETHQWMYDCVTLPALLRSLGYTGVRVQRYDTSYVDDWVSFGLDTNSDGGEYKPGSLYVEAMKD